MRWFQLKHIFYPHSTALPIPLCPFQYKNMPTKMKISSSVQKLAALLIFIAGGGLLQLLFASLSTRGFVGLLRDRDSNMLGLDSEPPKTSSNHDAASFLSSDASNTQEFNVTASKEKVSTQKTSTNEIRRDFNIGRDWNGYRIGDGIKFTYLPKKCSDPSWSWTLVCLYQNRTEERNNIDILLETLGEQQTIIRREQPLLELPKTDQVIMHLRLGDGLCGDERWDHVSFCGEQRPTNAGRFRNCWEHDYDCFFYNGNRYAYSQRWYDTIASDLASVASEISSNISIVSDARHWTRGPDRRKGNYSVDNKYRQEIASFLRGLDFTSIEFRNNEETHNSPDQDFAYLCSAKVFVPGGGGYSRLAAQVVERRGGMVIKPKDPDKELSMDRDRREKILQEQVQVQHTSSPTWNISTIIPVCNRLHSLQDAIESALQQTYPVLEVIVSIDSGPNCVKSIKNIWETKDDRVRVFKVPPCPKIICGWAGRVRNYAIEKASPYATHFAMLDDDDVWYPRKTDIQVKAMQQGNYSYSSSDANKPRKSRCHGSKYISHDLEKGAFFLANGGANKKIISKKLNISLDAKLPSHVTQAELKRHNFFVNSATIFSRDIFHATLGFDRSRRGQDYHLWLEFAKIGPGLFITDPLVVYDNKRNDCDITYTSDLYDGPP